MTKAMWRTVSAALAVTLAAAGAASAASYTNSATGNWSAGGSWTGAVPGAGGAADAEVVFSSAGVYSTNNLAGKFWLNRLEFAAGAATLSGNALVFTNNGATGPQIFNACGYAVTNNTPVELGRDTTVCTSNSITLNGLVSGKGGLIKAGPYNLTLTNNNNTYVGTTLVSAGLLAIQGVGSAATYASTNFAVLSGATLRINNGPNPYWTAPAGSVFTVQSNATFDISANALSCGYLDAASGATVNGSPQLNGADNAGRITANLGSVSFARIILNQATVANATQTLRFDGTGNGLVIGTGSSSPFSWRHAPVSGQSVIKMDIADSPAAAVDLLVPWLNLRPGAIGTSFYKQGSGVMQLNGLDWTGGGASSNSPVACTVSGGTLVLNTSAYNGVGVNFAGLTVSNGATLQVGTNGVFGALYTNVVNEGAVVFSRSDAYTFGKAISGAGGVVQSGSGTLTLAGANTYSGATLVSAGALLVNAPGSLAAGSAVTVAGGTLAGAGSAIGGPVTVSAGGTLAPGGTNMIDTLVLPNGGDSALTLAGGRLLFDLSNMSGTCDLLSVTGRLVLNGASTVALAFPSGTPPAGIYTLMTYASKTGTGTLTLSAPYPNARLTVGETSAVLTVTGAGIAYRVWKGGVSGTWDTTTENWAMDGVPSVYSDGDAVLFDDSATGNFTVGSAGAMTPSSVLFNNSTTNYYLAAGIAGEGAVLIKNGSSVATLSGTNTYGGGTVLNAGTVSVSSYSNLPPAGVLTFNGGYLRIIGTAINSLNPYTVNWESFKGGLNIDSGNTITVTNTLAGTGSLGKTGSGVLVLQGTNTYSGGTTVSSGTVRINNDSGLGSGAVNMSGTAQQLDLLGGLNVANAITVRNAGAGNSAGSLQSYYGTSNTWSGPVTLGDSNARLGAPRAVLTVRGVISSGANVYDLIIRNPNTDGGTIILAATNAYRGNTWIRCGTIQLGVNNALPVASQLHLGMDAPIDQPQYNVTNSTFDLAGFDQQLAGIVDRGTENVHEVTGGSPTPSTLTINNPSAYAFAGRLTGNLNLVKAGAGALTLSGANATFGSFTVNGGVLAVNTNGTLGANSTNILVNAGTLALSNSVGIADSATLRIATGGGAKVNLGAGVSEAVGYLYFDDKMRPGGTYGATGSGAQVADDAHFSGSGVLRVLHGNGGTLFKIR